MERQFKIGDLVRARLNGGRSHITALGFVTDVWTGSLWNDMVAVTYLKPLDGLGSPINRSGATWAYPFRGLAHVDTKTKE